MLFRAATGDINARWRYAVAIDAAAYCRLLMHTSHAAFRATPCLLLAHAAVYSPPPLMPAITPDVIMIAACLRHVAAAIIISP